MGCDIHTKAQRRNEDGQWISIRGRFFGEEPAPFTWRNYSVFGFLAGVRNYSDVTPIALPRGLPDDLKKYEGYDFGEHSFSWLLIEELANFPYERLMEDRRITMQIAPNMTSGAGLAEPGRGEPKTYRKFLGEAFFYDLEELQRIGATRVVFGFDS